MNTKVSVTDIHVADPAAIASTRAAVREQLLNEHYDPLIIVKASAAFTAVCEGVFKVWQQALVIRMTKIQGDESGVLFTAQVPCEPELEARLKQIFGTARQFFNESHVYCDGDVVCVILGLRG